MRSVRGPSDARVSHIDERLASCLNVECDATDDEPTPAVIVLHTLDAVHNVQQTAAPSPSPHPC